jgi:hypothetical protein
MQRSSMLMLDRLRIAYRKGGVRPECAPATAATVQKRHCSLPLHGAFSPIQPATR